MATESQCLTCKHYSEKCLYNSTGNILAPETGVQNAVDWCILEDRPIEYDEIVCPTYCRKDIDDYIGIDVSTGYSTASETVNLDSAIVKDLVSESRKKIFDEKKEPDKVVEELEKRGLTKEEAKIVINKALKKGGNFHPIVFLIASFILGAFAGVSVLWVELRRVCLIGSVILFATFLIKKLSR